MRILLLGICLITISCVSAQSYKAEIKRDEWGVAHIYGKTDADATYGLKWAHCEDDFHTIQEALLIGDYRAGRISGKDGMMLSAVAYLFNLDRQIDGWENEVSPAFKELLTAGAAAINDYAAMHPEEVKVKHLFPVEEAHLLKAYVFGQGILSYSGFVLADLFLKDLNTMEPKDDVGSNGWAYAPQKTVENQTVVVSNAHMPLKGSLTFYEAHVQSGEGMNIHGATMSLGVTLFIGTNEHLSWTHTTGGQDLTDIYELELDPENKFHYLIDGKSYPMHRRKNFVAKIGKLPPIRTTRKIFESEHFVAIAKIKGKFYGVRTTGLEGLRAGEQWYAMCKAQNKDEFWDALEQHKISVQNVIYGDEDGNILYMPNCYCPKREAEREWGDILAGTDADGYWEFGDYHPIRSLPYVENPASGYVTNSNNQPWIGSAGKKTPNFKDYEALKMGYLEVPTNRILRTMELMEDFEGKKLKLDDIKRLKYDLTYSSKTLENGKRLGIDSIFKLNPERYPDLAEGIRIFQNWDRSTHYTNKLAAYPILVIHLLESEANIAHELYYHDEKAIVKAMRKATKFMERHYGGLTPALGELQKLQLGKMTRPVSGAPDILSDTRSKLNGKHLVSYLGDTFIMFSQLKKGQDPQIETCMPYGTSMKKGDEHYGDQMELYTEQKTKKMSLNISDLNIADSYIVGSK